MTRILTVRIRPDLLARAEVRAAALGLDRGKYVRELIERDVSEHVSMKTRRFASEDFIGSVKIGGGPYTNERVRATIRARLLAKREANR